MHKTFKLELTNIYRYRWMVIITIETALQPKDNIIDLTSLRNWIAISWCVCIIKLLVSSCSPSPATVAARNVKCNDTVTISEVLKEKSQQQSSSSPTKHCTVLALGSQCQVNVKR